MTNNDIDHGIDLILDALEAGGMSSPIISAIRPALEVFIKYEAAKIKLGISDGSIVSDGHGGIVPRS